MAPTPRVALLLAVAGLSALVLPPFISVLAALAIAAAALADALLVRHAPSLERVAPEVMSRGIPEALTVSAESTWAGALRVRQSVPPDLVLAEPESDAPLRSDVVAKRRGRHVLPQAAARAQGPLGLGAWYHRGGGEAEVRVYPDLPAARSIALSVRRSRFRDQGLRGRGPMGLGTEFERVRDYSPDDDIRQVNWLATARMDRPMSNDYRIEQDRDVIAVVDAGRLMASPIGDATRLDVAMDALTSLAAVADEVGDRFGALVFDSEVRRYLAPSRGGGAIAVNALFDVEPEPVDSDYVRAFQRVEAAKRAWVVVFTDLLEEVAARSLDRRRSRPGEKAFGRRRIGARPGHRGGGDDAAGSRSSMRTGRPWPWTSRRRAAASASGSRMSAPRWSRRTRPASARRRSAPTSGQSQGRGCNRMQLA